MALKSFKELIVWQKSMDLCEEIYRLAHSFPASEIYGLSAQLKRAVISIPSNIAEGFSRNSTKEFIQFLYIANGSLSEVETQLDLAARLNFIEEERIPIEEIKHIRAMLTGLIKSLKNK
ncbi:four helix bundle protein [Proteiniphilum sp.]|uniref:four helix bundle protein n=1 Tax=Proteiniphilum sp. TaxID=1926877 RepID=UPI002B1F9C94|nr:four helix bundle protein [Proteiniphilum sp.]MEA4916791.1 four helix bundle protein [Proteiniphilum sp.]